MHLSSDATNPVAQERSGAIDGPPGLAVENIHGFFCLHAFQPYVTGFGAVKDPSCQVLILLVTGSQAEAFDCYL